MKMNNKYNIDETVLVETIGRVVDNLAKQFRFGYHSVEDLKQEGALEAIQALKDGVYDESRPLENFLYVHIRNRFINYRRNKFSRNEPPCKTCIFYDKLCKKSTNQCAAFTEKAECKKWSDWQTRNAAKKSLMQPTDVANASESAIEQSDSTFADVSFSEIRNKIDTHLPAELRSDYLRMLDGVSIPKPRRDKVREAVMEILE